MRVEMKISTRLKTYSCNMLKYLRNALLGSVPEPGFTPFGKTFRGWKVELDAIGLHSDRHEREDVYNISSSHT
jgi:hypothetical protein